LTVDIDRRVIVVVALLVVALVAFGGYRLHLRRTAVALENEIRAAGAPVTLAELNAWYEEPPGEDNAARAYIQAFDALADVGDQAEHLPLLGDAELPHRTEPIPREMREAISACLQDNAAALELVEHAAGQTRCRFPMDLRDGLNADLSHVPGFRHSAQLLMLQGVLSAHEQMRNAAYRAVSTQLALVRALAEEPTVVSQLVRLDCAVLAVQTLEQVLNRTALASDQLEELVEGFQQAEEAHAVARGVAGRRCIAMDAARSGAALARFLETASPTGGPAPRGGAVTARLWSWSGMLTCDRTDCGRWATQLYRAGQGPFPEGLHVIESVRAEVAAVWRWRSPLAELLVQSLPGAVEAEARHRALMRMAIVALAVEQHRLAHGRPPETMAQLVPDTLPWAPTDPCATNAELHYRRDVKGHVVYSRGLNGKDDGGAEAPDLDTAWRQGDLTFTVERLLRR